MAKTEDVVAQSQAMPNEDEFRRRLQEQVRAGIGAPEPTQPLPDPGYTDHGITTLLQAHPTSVTGDRTVSETGYYSRMFPDLPAFAPDDDALKKLGAPAGMMDANPPESAPFLGPGSVIDNTRLNWNLPAGLTFFGQFLDHNITFQADGTFDVGQDPGQTMNYRSGRISLEHVYGFGPQTQSFCFYDNDLEGKFWIDPAFPHDVPRNSECVPLIADPRNDNTIITVQLHLAFMKFHNAVVDLLAEVDKDRLFYSARRNVTWHYQWLVVHEWLQKIIQPLVFDKLNSEDWTPRFFNPAEGDPLALPIEFTVAGYRLHSLITETYQLNDQRNAHLFHFRKPYSRLMPEDIVDWSLFFSIPTGKFRPQYAKKFDGTVAHTFLNMPGPIDTPIEWIEDPSRTELLPRDPNESYVPLRSIAIRNLLRGKAFRLPSGEDVAKAVQDAYGRNIVPKIYNAKEMGLDTLGFDQTPLWYYVMKEGMLGGESTGNGDRLGPVGSVIVGEVLFGLLRADPSSYLTYNNHNPGNQWKPTLGRVPGEFTMADLIRQAGV